MKHPFALFVGKQQRVSHIGSIAAAVLLVVLVGGLAFGLVLVRHGKAGPSGQPATATRTPAAASHIYLVKSDGTVYKVDGTTHHVLWNYHEGGEPNPVADTPVIADGLVFFATQDRVIVALDASTGKLRWRVTLSGGEQGSVQMTLANGLLFYPSEGGDSTLYAFNPTNGSIAWQVQIVPGAPGVPGTPGATPAFLTSVIVADSTIYGIAYPFGNVPPSKLYALSLSTHQMLWQAPTAGDQFFNGPPVLVNGRVYVTTQEESQHRAGEPRDSYVYAYDALSGKQDWQSTKVQNITAAPAVTDGEVYVDSDDGVTAFSAATGQARWQTTVRGSTAYAQPPLAADGAVYIGAPQMMALNASDGSFRWQQASPSSVSGAFALGGSVLYVLAPNNTLYALKASDGTQIWNTPLDKAVLFPSTFGASVTLAP